ncbi:MAG: DMT family transporter [Thiobacillaceae bacterium]|nr:DMT family transporter [Thiobacillaceae bacterium]MCX7674193.1 DMT family transporter [Thiobacillaceae bacterium]
MNGWIVPAAIAFVTWGLWAFVPKLTTRHLDPRSVLFFQTLGAFVVGLAVLASLNFRPALHGPAVGLALLTGALGAIGGLAYVWAIARGPASLVAVLTALYPLLTILLALAFLGETLSARQWSGIILALVALALIVG